MFRTIVNVLSTLVQLDKERVPLVVVREKVGHDGKFGRYFSRGSYPSVGHITETLYVVTGRRSTGFGHVCTIKNIMSTGPFGR